MESFLSFICEYSAYAHFIVFGLLLLAGFNIPVSEDATIITAGVLISTCIPEHFWLMYGFAYAGSVIGGWEAFWVGHHFGRKLYNIRWFKRFITPERIAKLHYYYEKFGVLSFIVIRFTPGGVRNGFSMTCGLSEMSFPSFLIRDGFAAIFSVSTLFYIGYAFGQNSELLFQYVKEYNEWALGITILVATLITSILWYRKKFKKPCDDEHI